MTQFNVSRDTDVRIYPHQPGEHFWLHYGWVPKVMPHLRMRPEQNLGDVQMVKTVEVDESGAECDPDMDMNDYVGECCTCILVGLEQSGKYRGITVEM